jgi:hypothetical protein
MIDSIINSIRNNKMVMSNVCKKCLEHVQESLKCIDITYCINVCILLTHFHCRKVLLLTCMCYIYKALVRTLVSLHVVGFNQLLGIPSL